MTLQGSTVTVKELPQIMNENQGSLFLRELEGCLNHSRPSIVLNCSKVSKLDTGLIYLLLRCLEETMKRNGDLKLASVPQEAMAALKLNGVSRLFETFAGNAEAIDSFHQFSLDAS